MHSTDPSTSGTLSDWGWWKSTSLLSLAILSLSVSGAIAGYSFSVAVLPWLLGVGLGVLAGVTYCLGDSESRTSTLGVLGTSLFLSGVAVVGVAGKYIGAVALGAGLFLLAFPMFILMAVSWVAERKARKLKKVSLAISPSSSGQPIPASEAQASVASPLPIERSTGPYVAEVQPAQPSKIPPPSGWIVVQRASPGPPNSAGGAHSKPIAPPPPNMSTSPSPTEEQPVHAIMPIPPPPGWVVVPDASRSTAQTSPDSAQVEKSGQSSDRVTLRLGASAQVTSGVQASSAPSLPILETDKDRWALCALVEANLRRLIAITLEASLSANAWEVGIPKDLRKRIEEHFKEREKRRLKDVPNLEVRLTAAYLQDLVDLVKARWRTFSPCFDDNRPVFDTQVGLLIRMRNALDHVRPDRLPTGEEDPSLRPAFDTNVSVLYRSILRALADREAQPIEMKGESAEPARLMYRTSTPETALARGEVGRSELRQPSSISSSFRAVIHRHGGGMMWGVGTDGEVAAWVGLSRERMFVRATGANSGTVRATLAQVMAKAREVANARGAKLRTGQGTPYDVVLISGNGWMSCDLRDRYGGQERIRIARATPAEMNALRSEFDLAGTLLSQTGNSYTQAGPSL